MNWLPLRVVALTLAAGWLPHACTGGDVPDTPRVSAAGTASPDPPEVVDFLFWPAHGWNRIGLELALDRGSRAAAP